jgi:hypothetical protein
MKGLEDLREAHLEVDLIYLVVWVKRELVGKEVAFVVF